MPTSLRPFCLARRARATAFARPPATGSDSSTFVKPFSPAGRTSSAFGFVAGAVTVPAALAPEPGAAGSGPVVIVGWGAFGRVAVVATGTVPRVAPGPSGTLVVAVAGPEALERVPLATSTAAV